MASGILTPRSRRPALTQASAFAAIHTLTSHVSLDDASYTPSLATPELGWAETPPATQDPRTPGNHPELNDGVLSPHSPLAIRNPDLERHDNSVLDLSQLDSDVPKQLLSKLSGETSPTRRLFQSELSDVSGAASSRPQPSPSNDSPPAVPGSFLRVKVEQGPSSSTPFRSSGPKPSSTQSRDGTIGTNAGESVFPAAAGNIKTEDGLAISEGTFVMVSQSKTTTTTPTTAPPPCSATKQPLTLSVAWALSTKLSTILPLEAVERFQADRLKCVATTKAGLRCTRSTARTSKANFVIELFGALSLLQCSYDFAAFAKHMAPFIESVMCTQSHMEPWRACWDELCSYSWEPGEIVTAKAHQAKAIANSIEAVFTLWISALMAVPHEAKVANPPTEGNTESVRGTLCSTLDLSRTATVGNHAPFSLDRPKTTATSGPGSSHVAETSNTVSLAISQVVTSAKPAYLSTHLNHRFIKFVWPGKKKDATPQQLIRQLLFEPLTLADMNRSGFIYVFWHPPSSGYVKIGYTDNVKKRLADWRRKCGFELEEVKSEEFPAQRIMHTRRIESLVHAELKDHRLFEPSCKGCKSKHKEWFEVDQKLALRVVAKWTGRSFYSGGRLEASLCEDDIEKLCELTEAGPALPPPQAKKTTNTRVKAPRRSNRGGRRDVRGRR